MERVYTFKAQQPNHEQLLLNETIFHTANGYLGVRGTLEEGVPLGYDTMRGTYINGFYDMVPMKQAESLANLVEDKESMLNVADTQSIILQFDEEVFSMNSGQVVSYHHKLDMDKGITERTIDWESPNGKKVHITFIRMASFRRPNLFTIECKVRPINFSGTLRVTSHHKALVSNYASPNDPRLGNEGLCFLDAVASKVNECRSMLVAKTKSSNLSVCSGVEHLAPVDVPPITAYNDENHSATTTFQLPLERGTTVEFTKLCALADSIRHNDVVGKVSETLNTAVYELETLYKEQQSFLYSFWQQSVLHIEGDDETNLALCFNMYQLLQSAGRDGVSSIAAKGLSGEGYEGHYFWDTEMYAMPFFTLTNPDMARKLLEYRFSTLDKARVNAKRMGHKTGALFAWRTITGRECSGYFPSGAAAYHINGAVAYAVTAYYLHTGDKEFFTNIGAEILVETARLWLDAGNWVDGRFEIHEVTGPDEYTCMVSNNFYTNAVAKYNLEWGAKAVEHLQENSAQAAAALRLLTDEAAAMRNAAQAMHLPYDEVLGINPQDDGFLKKPRWDFEGTKDRRPLLLHFHPLYLYRHQVCKQADTVLAYFLFPEIQPKYVVEKSFKYYEDITTHDSTLSKAVFSLVAANLGEYDIALGYLGDSAKTDLFNTHNNTQHGLHTANMGGCYMAIVNGLGGLRVTEAGLFLSPYLPKNWQGYTFRFHYKGSVLECLVRRKRSVLALVSGGPLKVYMGGSWREVTADKPVVCETKME